MDLSPFFDYNHNGLESACQLASVSEIFVGVCKEASMVQEIPLYPTDTAQVAESGVARQDALANRQRILDTARRLFAERGVAAVTMAEIAQAAGVGKGTLYRHFAHKGALCRALLHERFRRHQDEMLARLQAFARDRIPALERIKAFLRASAAFIQDHSALLLEVQQAYGLTPAEDAPMMQWLRLTLLGLLREGIRSGELIPDLNLELTVDLLLAPLTALYFQHLIRRMGYTPDQIADGLYRLIQGLAMPSTTPG